MGECQTGTWACDGEGVRFCDGQVQPATEMCDGRDNDCDGFADNDVLTYFDGTSIDQSVASNLAFSGTSSVPVSTGFVNIAGRSQDVNKTLRKVDGDGTIGAGAADVSCGLGCILSPGSSTHLFWAGVNASPCLGGDQACLVGVPLTQSDPPAFLGATRRVAALDDIGLPVAAGATTYNNEKIVVVLAEFFDGPPRTMVVIKVNLTTLRGTTVATQSVGAVSSGRQVFTATVGGDDVPLIAYSSFSGASTTQLARVDVEGSQLTNFEPVDVGTEFRFGSSDDGKVAVASIEDDTLWFRVLDGATLRCPGGNNANDCANTLGAAGSARPGIVHHKNRWFVAYELADSTSFRIDSYDDSGALVDRSPPIAGAALQFELAEEADAAGSADVLMTAIVSGKPWIQHLGCQP